MASPPLSDEKRPGLAPGSTAHALIGVAIVDDQQMFLTGVAAALAGAPDIYVTGTAKNVPSAIQLIERTAPDVVVTDIQMGEQSGLALLDHFQDGPPIIMLTSFDHMIYYQAALERGAAGYVLKSSLIEQLVDTIRMVAAGEIAFPAQSLPGGRRAGGRTPSRRELEVIQLVAEGASNEEIAERLAISRKTVDSHLRGLFDRHGVVSRTELAMHAVAVGWLRTAVGGTRAGRDRWMIDEEVIRGR